MTFQEKRLYHQIHPLKLFTDWSTGFIALYMLWRRHLSLALILMFVPGIIVSSLLVRWATLEPYKQSAFGHYVKRSITPSMEAVRLAGYGGFCITCIGQQQVAQLPSRLRASRRDC